ncbi:MAG TPA: SdiA-regulated domain-containing protein [Bacteroidota bacterium]|nr:SdiA-regulated domain-containing protein [Bacteroidota bacterium]
MAESADGMATLTTHYDFASKPAIILTLPSFLREVSGIALTKDGRLFAHNDERGAVYRIDPATGKMIKQFAVGERRLQEDLEDIAIVGDTFYLVSSKGDLFAFREGRGKENVPYMAHKTGLTAKNDVEGLCYDPETGCLLLACKADPGVDLVDARAVYAFDLRTRKLLPRPRFLIDLKDLKKRFGLKEFMPSGIARHPATGNFFVISSVGNSLIELSPGGKVLSYTGLPKKYHEQPEGIVIDKDGRLLIANEGPRKGTIVVYKAGKK